MKKKRLMQQLFPFTGLPEKKCFSGESTASPTPFQHPHLGKISPLAQQSVITPAQTFSRWQNIPRRQVPWNLFDFLLIFAFFIFCGSVCARLVTEFRPIDLPLPEMVAELSVTESAGINVENSELIKLKKEHPLTVLLATGKQYPSIIVLCFIAAVIAAPLCEEFLFRIVLQGSLESLEHRLGRLFRLRRWFPRGFFCVFVTAFLFAAMHFRSSDSEIIPNHIFSRILAGTIAGFMTFLFGILYLKFGRGATFADLGFSSKRILPDIAGALLVYLVILFPMLFVQGTLQFLFPNYVTDPVPLMILALALGILCFRTRRLLPSLILHVLVNGVSFLVILLFMT